MQPTRSSTASSTEAKHFKDLNRGNGPIEIPDAQDKATPELGDTLVLLDESQSSLTETAVLDEDLADPCC